MRIVKSESKETPILIDKNSSPTTVYIRADVEEKHRENEQGEQESYYSYTEKQLTKDEFEMYSVKELLADLAELIVGGGF